MRKTNALYLKKQRLIAETHRHTDTQTDTWRDTHKHTHRYNQRETQTETHAKIYFKCFSNNNVLRFMCEAKGRVNISSSSLYVCVSLWLCVSLCVCLHVCVSAINICLFKYNAFVLRILLVPVLVNLHRTPIRHLLNTFHKCSIPCRHPSDTLQNPS